MKILWKMEHLLFWSKCSIFHNSFKYMIFQRCQKVLLWSKRVNNFYLFANRGAVMIWKPKVTPMSELRPNELHTIQSATGDEVQVSQRTSLARQHQDVSYSICPIFIWSNCSNFSCYNRKEISSFQCFEIESHYSTKALPHDITNDLWDNCIKNFI